MLPCCALESFHWNRRKDRSRKAVCRSYWWLAQVRDLFPLLRVWRCQSCLCFSEMQIFWKGSTAMVATHLSDLEVWVYLFFWSDEAEAKWTSGVMEVVKSSVISQNFIPCNFNQYFCNFVYIGFIRLMVYYTYNRHTVLYFTYISETYRRHIYDCERLMYRDGIRSVPSWHMAWNDYLNKLGRWFVFGKGGCDMLSCWIDV